MLSLSFNYRKILLKAHDLNLIKILMWTPNIESKNKKKDVNYPKFTIGYTPYFDVGVGGGKYSPTGLQLHNVYFFFFFSHSIKKRKCQQCCHSLFNLIITPPHNSPTPRTKYLHTLILSYFLPI